ncbi:abortive phage infection protein [Corynebacterium falsenii DSM 44353]|uniref:CPBP family intramembrane glutamic endopeptidase n=1 Tax=Corynebacterium falsenii TaxID=108486 RepID=UPI0003E938BD|nr:type II CAAX endopeptidase family protein [Corynebacterium falsenii]AHI02327.1 abortive phage infection protein [Corynebacterium falsenii DSM 44353]UBI05096.1 CPBP family intramembrane metalloprotease [Corynebacterium falsenii]
MATVRVRMATADRRALRWELLIVLTITFGTSGVRAVLRLIEAAARPENLNDQEATLNQRQSVLPWLDPLFQLISSGVLIAWGGLAIFLLLRHVPVRVGDAGALSSGAPNIAWRMRGADWLHGAGLAAVIGLPGLVFYFGAVALGLSKQVVPTGLGDSPWEIPLLVVNAWANGFAEEWIVVAWLATRLRQLRVNWVWVFVASAVLRGSYHLYQGYSAGVGNIIMGVVYLWYFKKTGRVWPLVIGHALIDTVAFVGYPLVLQ